MATKTKAIEVKVDERLALEIADKGVKSWHSTSFSNGKRRVYVTFEEIKAVSACLALALGIGFFCGCSSLQPATKSQSMTVTALGFPAITVVTTTSQAATNDGDDEGDNAQTTSADVKPDVDASILPTA